MLEVFQGNGSESYKEFNIGTLRNENNGVIVVIRKNPFNLEELNDKFITS